MNALAPPKKSKTASLRDAALKLQLHTGYHIAAFNAKLLEKPYWFWESLRGRLADRLDNEEIDG
jgi:hypothetical protein